MSIVKFPGLGFEFNISQIAFTIFGISVYNYAICIIIGIVVAFFLCAISKEKFGIKYDNLVEIIVESLLIGILGARAFYVIFQMNHYLSNPIQILNIRDGGLAIFGGLIAGGYVIIKKCQKNNISYLDFFDYIVPFLAIAQSFGRWGNFFNIEAYGIQTANIFRMGINTVNGYLEVHPVFLYESIATMLIFIILKIMQKSRKYKGQIFYYYLFFYASIRIVLETLRTDSLMFFDVKISQIISIILFIMSAFVIIKHKLIQNKNKKKQ